MSHERTGKRPFHLAEIQRSLSFPPLSQRARSPQDIASPCAVPPENIISLDRINDEHQLRQLAVASLLEATTLVLLVFVGVPLKHLASWPLATSILGPVHGVAFLFYMRTVLVAVASGGWTRWEIARLVLTAFIPFGGYSNIPLLRRRRRAQRQAISHVA